MDKALQDAFRKLKQRDVDTFPVSVVSVDKTNGTCSVEDGSITYTNVQLASVIDTKKTKFYLFPVVGSSVLVSPINENINRLYVEAYSEIESISISVETSIEFSTKMVELTLSDGFLLKKENETLKKLMLDLFEAIETMSFTVQTTGTPVAQSGATTTLVNKAVFAAIKNRFKTFLK